MLMRRVDTDTKEAPDKKILPEKHKTIWNKIGNFFRRTAQVFLAFLLTSLLFLFVTFVPITSSLSRPETIKSWLNDSNIYKEVVPYAAKSLTGSIAKENKEASQDVKDLGQAVNKAFPPEFIQRSIEQIIDSVYTWLKGETEKPEFNIDLSDRKEAVSKELEHYLAGRLKDAPICKEGEVNVEEYNPFSDNCLPKGTKAKKVAKEFVAQLMHEDGPLAQASINSEDIFKTDNKKGSGSNNEEKPENAGPDINTVFAYGPIVYDSIGLARFIIISLIVAISSILILIAKTRRGGVKLLSHTMLHVGLWSLIATFIGTKVITNVFGSESVPIGPSTQFTIPEEAKPLFDTIVNDLANTVYIYAGLLVFISASTLILLHLIISKKHIISIFGKKTNGSIN